MQNPVRIRTRRRTILEALKMGNGYAIPEVSLRLHVDALVRPPTTDEEWQSDIAALSGETTGAMVTVPNKLDETLVQWLLTERGETLLASLS